MLSNFIKKYSVYIYKLDQENDFLLNFDIYTSLSKAINGVVMTCGQMIDILFKEKFKMFYMNITLKKYGLYLFLKFPFSNYYYNNTTLI